MENHMQFWAFLQVCRCCLVRNLLSSNLDSIQSVSFRALDPGVQYWAGAGTRLHWWDAWSTCKLIPRLIWNAGRCSRTVLRSPHTPWWGKDASKFRLSRRVGWCWGVWLVLGCGFLWRLFLRLRHRWSFILPGSWWRPFSLWEYACRAWLCQRFLLRWFFLGCSYQFFYLWSYPKPSQF